MSYAQAEHRVHAQYLALHQTGTVIPANSGIDSLNLVLLLGWLLACLSMSESIYRWSRVPVFAGIVISSAWNLYHVRSIGVVGSIGVGLNSALFTILAVNFVLLYDPRKFKRLVLRPTGQAPNTAEPVDLKSNRTPGRLDSGVPLAWESMPKSLPRRLFWVLDLVTSMRGIHWSWNPSPSPPYSQSLRVARSDRSATIFRSLSRFLIDYFFIDLVKCLMIADPYFFGSNMQEVSPRLPVFGTSPLALSSYRLLLGLTGAYLAIDLQYTATVLVQVNILGPSVLGLKASPVLFPPIWGSPRAVLRKGLRGFWGETWHQMFRMHFASIGNACADYLLRHKSPKSSKPPSAKRWIRVVVVFLLSGILHACASYTLLGPTRPWRSFLFFALQPAGMAAQSLYSQLFSRSWLERMLGRAGTVVRQTGNLTFTILWFWATGGLLLEDLSSGGMWMFEPVPISILRGLGFSEDRRFWCW
ncbi:hypothetical protein A1O7_01370 [Cladophialophora yegresii CBS 114405]|uniref:Wax synthase domain-containing protein n=1 Tax=Cladophialophora yegresii CBS 114405 TaxID=1182544 RepID=W9WK83_9EURO|nr:uncharacterized protein A1O7_01370 [Cladophialophora yegresii CBS 114405]EXJ65031.1 hypothetical protein A1O7_01370 [Cladophialophora yegresii CBS 114405]